MATTTEIYSLINNITEKHAYISRTATINESNTENKNSTIELIKHEHIMAQK